MIGPFLAHNVFSRTRERTLSEREHLVREAAVQPAARTVKTVNENPSSPWVRRAIANDLPSHPRGLRPVIVRPSRIVFDSTTSSPDHRAGRNSHDSCA